ncbi:flavodoxin-dependent (E)-4-hydroxy-3-methylbut-2-enyl-diphosphate synthase, partial [Bacillus subtilis]|uniref:flavodoxin-dependent (E)-4-hydroxy-3-methylbut-2-enyl-diphosphate synthase n=1 Tax=Bacillus subtilis TaxID=1423 RepID=UPI00338F4CBE
ERLQVSEMRDGRKRRRVKVGGLRIGGKNEVVMERMRRRKRDDVEGRVGEIKGLGEGGWEMVGVGCGDEGGGKGIGDIKKGIWIGVVVEIDLDYKVGLKGIEGGFRMGWGRK